MSKPPRATRASERARFNRFLKRNLAGLTDAELDEVEVNYLSAYVSERCAPTGRRGRPVSPDEIVLRITSAGEYHACEDTLSMEALAVNGERPIGSVEYITADSGALEANLPTDDCPPIDIDGADPGVEQVERVEASEDALDHAESLDDFDLDEVDAHFRAE